MVPKHLVDAMAVIFGATDVRAARQHPPITKELPPTELDYNSQLATHVANAACAYGQVPFGTEN